jgi:hypothetical protein
LVEFVQSPQTFGSFFSTSTSNDNYLWSVQSYPQCYCSFQIPEPIDSGATFKVGLTVVEPNNTITPPESDGWYIQISLNFSTPGTNVCSFKNDSTTYFTTTSISPSSIYSITYDGSFVRLYIDGVEEVQELWSLTAGQSVYFGAHSVNDYIDGVSPSLSNVVFGPMPLGFIPGTNYGDYLYWNGTNWVIGDTQITLGKYAGQTGQGYNYTVSTHTENVTSTSDFDLDAFLAGATDYPELNVVTVRVVGGGGAGAGSGIGDGSGGGLPYRYSGYGGISGQLVTQTFFNASGTISSVIGAAGTPGGPVVYTNSISRASYGATGGTSTANFGGTVMTASGGAPGSATYTGFTTGFTQNYITGQNPPPTGGTNGTGYGTGGNGGDYLAQTAGQIGSNGAVTITVQYLTAVSDNPSASSVSLGENAGSIYQGTDSIAIGKNAGNCVQRANSVAIGDNSGQNWQGYNSVAIGYQAGQNYQGGMTGITGSTVAIGDNAGQIIQGTRSVAIGYQAGQFQQGGMTGGSVAIGELAGKTGQGPRSVAIGYQAGQFGQARSSVAIGDSASASGTMGSIALGFNAAALGYSSVAIGYGATGTGNGSVAIGAGATAGTVNNHFGVAIGANSFGNSQGVAVGRGASASTNAVALGSYAIAQPGYIVLNGSGANFNPDTGNPNAAGFFTTSVRAYNNNTTGGKIYRPLSYAAGQNNSGDNTYEVVSSNAIVPTWYYYMSGPNETRDTSGSDFLTWANTTSNVVFHSQSNSVSFYTPYKGFYKMTLGIRGDNPNRFTGIVDYSNSDPNDVKTQVINAGNNQMAVVVWFGTLDANRNMAVYILNTQGGNTRTYTYSSWTIEFMGFN